MIDERTADHIMRALGAIEANGGTLKVTHKPEPVIGQDSAIILTSIDVAVNAPQLTTHAVGGLSVTGPTNIANVMKRDVTRDAGAALSALPEDDKPIRWEIGDDLIIHFEELGDAGDMNVAIVTHNPSHVTDITLSLSSRVRMARELLRNTDFVVAPNSAV